jgi:hypothetical protein
MQGAMKPEAARGELASASNIDSPWPAGMTTMPRSSVLELRTLYPEHDVTAYIVVEVFGRLGRAFRETDFAPKPISIRLSAT